MHSLKRVSWSSTDHNSDAYPPIRLFAYSTRGQSFELINFYFITQPLIETRLPVSEAARPSLTLTILRCSGITLFAVPSDQITTRARHQVCLRLLCTHAEVYSYERVYCFNPALSEIRLHQIDRCSFYRLFSAGLGHRLVHTSSSCTKPESGSLKSSTTIPQPIWLAGLPPHLPSMSKSRRRPPQASKILRPALKFPT